MKQAAQINCGGRAGEVITLAHGGGGKAMRDLIAEVFVGNFNNPYLAMLEDQARIDLDELAARGDRLAMTTDSYVVSPLFFAGGDIGKLAVSGTVNDLAVGGAIPLFLSCGMIIEEGLAMSTLREVTASMREAAKAAAVQIVTGDTKVVPRGAADQLFINTAGVGVIPARIDTQSRRARPGDVIIVNGFIGDHGAAIVDARGELSLQSNAQSDCRPLNGLTQKMLSIHPGIHCMRDATRGGIAAVANEFAEASGVGVELDESAIPLRDSTRGVCEILGLDPLYLANEGKLVAVVAAAAAEAVLAGMLSHPAGEHSAIIGRVREKPRGRVVLKTAFGGERVLDTPIGEQLPRIC